MCAGYQQLGAQASQVDSVWKNIQSSALDKVIVSGLHCKHPDKLVAFLPCCPLTEHSASCHISTNHHSGTGCHRCTWKTGLCVCVASQSARGLTHGDPPLPDFCVFFHFVPLQSSWLCDLIIIFCTVCFDKPLPFRCLLSHHHSKPRRGWLCLSTSSPIIQKTTCVYVSSEQTWLTCFLSRNTFVKCRSQHPEAVFSSWIPPLWPVLLCSSAFLQPRLWDALSSILLIQGCQNEECEGICEYHLWLRVFDLCLLCLTFGMFCRGLLLAIFTLLF